MNASRTLLSLADPRERLGFSSLFLEKCTLQYTHEKPLGMRFLTQRASE